MMGGLRNCWPLTAVNLIILIVISLLWCCNLSEARHHHHNQKLPSAVVVGAVYCDTCFQDDTSKGSHYISGATVAVECAEGSKRAAFYEEVQTDKQGKFKVELPFSVSKHVREIQGCNVKLIKSSEPYCAVASTASSSLIHLKERKGGKHIFSAGFFTFKPLKQPGLCNQQPSVTKTQLNSLQDLLPNPSSPPTGPNLPLMPGLPDLPPLPSLPSLPPLPPLPKVPFYPSTRTGTIPSARPYKDTRVENGLVPKPQFLFPPIISPPQTGLPLPPNPLQPAPLVPNPFQPPAPPLIPNRFQPPTPPPGLLPPVPQLPPLPNLPPIPGFTPTPSPPPPASSFPFPPIIPVIPPGTPLFPGFPPVVKPKKMNP